MDIGQGTMGAGELTGSALRAWFSRFIEILPVAAVFTIPVFLIESAVGSALLEATTDGLDIGDLRGALLANLIGLVVGAVQTAALVECARRVYRREPIQLGATVQAVADKFLPIFVFAVLTSLAIVAGFIALIVPGIALIIAFSLGMPAMLDEDLDGVRAMGRSFELIGGRWGTAIGVVLLGIVIAFAGSLVLGGLSVGAAGLGGAPTFDDFSIGRLIVQLAASSLLAPLIPMLATALYFEFKGRESGFPSV